MGDPLLPSTLRVALLGAGTFATSAHFPLLLALEEDDRVSIRLVWSRTEASAASLAQLYGPHVSSHHYCPSSHDSPLHSARDTLRAHRAHLDAVILSVPIPHLASFSRMVLEERLHLFSEKPLAADILSARQLLVEAQLRDCVHAVGENFRFEPVFRMARCMVEDMEGGVIAMSLSIQSPMPVGSKYARGWRLQLPGVGILLDGMVHHIAGLRVLVGSDVKSVSAICKRSADTFAGCDTVTGHLCFANDVPASICVTYAATVFSWQLRVTGFHSDILIARNVGVVGYTLSNIKKDSNGLQVERTHVPFSGLEAELEAFVDSCGINMVHPDLSATSAFNDLATVHALFDSSNRGETVHVQKWNV